MNDQEYTLYTTDEGDRYIVPLGLESALMDAEEAVSNESEFSPEWYDKGDDFQNLLDVHGTSLEGQRLSFILPKLDGEYV